MNYIITFAGRTGTSLKQGKELLTYHNLHHSKIKFDYHLTHSIAVDLTIAEYNKIRKDSRIHIIEPEHEYNIEPILEQSLTRKQAKAAFTIDSTQPVPWGVADIGGFSAGNTKAVAWVLDTGVDYTHPDLNVNKTLAKSFIPGVISATDDNGHGTHCAGIIGAKNNEFGVVGVCPGVMVVPVKCLSSNGAGSTTTILNGLNYIKSQFQIGKINVVNMSFGGTPSVTIDNAVTALANSGFYVVIAAGNNSKCANGYSPCRISGAKIFTISAYDSKGKMASFSNWGNPPVDYSAPGVAVYSCYKGGTYAYMSGTSMSCPHVAGILLANNGIIHSNGYITGDLDGTPGDLKAHI